MVDEARVHRLLRYLSETLSQLDREVDADAERRADPIWLRGIKYLFVTAIESCTDVAQHICAAQGWRPPNDNGHAMRVLADHGVLPAPLGQRMSDAVGFRNILVHQYVDTDDERVEGQLDDLGDLRDFRFEVLRYLEGNSEADGR